MKVTIDPKAGFCPGVKRAIKIAEEYLRENGELYCLGEIVHNIEEVKRLEGLGLKTIGYEEFVKLRDANVLIRSHGEPPETYEIAERRNIRLIDATCKTVQKLQEKVRHHSAKMSRKGGRLVIYGKAEHPEVRGLYGHAGNNAVIIRNPREAGKVDTSSPIRLFSQTTMDIEQYGQIKRKIMEGAASNTIKPDFEAYDTVCKQVEKRAPYLREFAGSYDVIIFVSGKKSSNGNYLFSVCKSVNPRSYFIASENELQKSWFRKNERIGVSGATSTPQWLMEKVANTIKGFI